MTELTRHLRDCPYELFPRFVQQPLRIDVCGPDGRRDGDQALDHSYRTRGERGATLRALDRVAWVRLDLDGNRHVATISRIYGELEDAEPCYYLPWIQNRTLGMKLKPSRKIEEDARFDAYPDRPGVDADAVARATAQRDMLRGIDNVERRTPRLFFTAMLTGCSVHIDGDAAQPNVFHGNATRLGNPAGRKSTALMRTRKHFGRRMEETDAVLRHEYQSIRWDDRDGSCVSVLDYDFRMWGNGALAQKWQHGADLLTDELRDAGARINDMRAVVFGAANLDGAWTFYGQRIYRYRIGQDPMAFLGYPPQRIWPGHGHIQI